MTKQEVVNDFYTGPPEIEYVHTEALVINQLFEAYQRRVSPLTYVDIPLLYVEALLEDELYHQK